MACPVDLVCYPQISRGNVNVSFQNYEVEGECAKNLTPTLVNEGDNSISIKRIYIDDEEYYLTSCELSSCKVSGDPAPSDFRVEAKIEQQEKLTFYFLDNPPYSAKRINFEGDDIAILGNIVHLEGEFQCPPRMGILASNPPIRIGFYFLAAAAVVALAALLFRHLKPKIKSSS